MDRVLLAIKRFLGPTPEDWLFDVFVVAAFALIVIGSYRLWLHAR